MALNLSVIKKKPVLVGAGVIGAVVVLFFLMRGNSASEGSAAAGGVPALGYTDTQVAAASQIAQLQGQMQMQANDIQGQLALANIAASTQLAINQSNNDLQADMAAFSLEAARMDYAAQMAGIQASERIEMMGLEKSSYIQELTIQSQLTAMQSQMDRDVAMQQMMTDAQINMAQIAGTIQLAGISAQESIAHHTLDATTQQIKYQNELQLGLSAHDVEEARIAADASKYSAKKQSSSSKWSSVAGVALGALALFSDINIKTIHGCVSTSKCLSAIVNSPIDFWTYLDSENLGDEMHVGTYVQDFYRELGCPDWNERKSIHVVDAIGALSGAIKELAKSQVKAAA